MPDLAVLQLDVHAGALVLEQLDLVADAAQVRLEGLQDAFHPGQDLVATLDLAVKRRNILRVVQVCLEKK